MLPSCQACGRELAVGESAWADDWKVIDTSGTTVTFRMETRYTCEECAATDDDEPDWVYGGWK